MFIIPCKFTPDCSIFECVSNINIHHPTEKIIIVDSNSLDTSYLDRIKKYNNVYISDKSNCNYEVGALWVAYEQYPNEPYYALIHDSLIIKNNISKFISDNLSYVFMYFPEAMDINEPAYGYVMETLGKTEYAFDNAELIGALGSMCVLKPNIMQNFIKKRLNVALLPTDKFQSQQSERMIGFCLSKEGVDLTVNNIEGNFLSRVDETKNNQLFYFNKIFKARQ